MKYKSEKLKKYLVNVFLILPVAIYIASCSIQSNLPDNNLVQSEMNSTLLENGITNDEKEIYESNYIALTPSVYLSTISETKIVVPTYPVLSDRILICQRDQHGNVSNAMNFYWLSFTSELSSNLEPYFSIDIPASEIWNIRFNNDDNSFIYITDNEYASGNSIIKFNVPNERRIITNNADVIYIDENSNVEKLFYITGNYRLYVIDYYGSGRQYATEYFVYPNAVFSPDGKKIAFVGEIRIDQSKCSILSNTPTDMNLFVVELDEANNPMQLSSEKIQEGNCGKKPYGYHLLWSTDSKNIVFTREVKKNHDVICLFDIEKNTENCFYEYEFVSIGKHSLSNDDKLVFSALDDIDKKNEICKEGCYTAELDWNLYLLDISNSQMQIIVNDDIAEIDPNWTVDGNFIVYRKYIDNNWQLFIADKTGRLSKQLTYSNVNNYLDGECLP